MSNSFTSFLISALAIVALGAGCSKFQSRSQFTWHLVLQVEPMPPYPEVPMSETITVLENRLNRLGVSGFKVEPEGAETKKQIRVSLRDVPDRERLKRLLTSMGRLEIAHVIGPSSPAPIQEYKSESDALSFVNASPSNRRALKYSPSPSSNNASWVVVEVPSLINGTELRTASPIASPRGGKEYTVVFTLVASGGKTLETWASNNKDAYVAVILNNEIKNTSVIRSSINDQGAIAGRFTMETAQELADSLNSGPLPTRVRIIEEKSN